MKKTIVGPLKDKTVFITGASSGIGAACAQAFAAEGANLILCARRQTQLEKISAGLVRLFNIKVHVIGLDITSKKEIGGLLNQIPPSLNKIDILVNNAGLALGLEKMQEANIDDLEKMIDTNLKGLLYMTHWALPHMIKRDQGHIINIGSIAGRGVYAKGVVYCATKHAVQTFSQGLRMDLCGTRIKVTLIEPGLVKTEFSLVRYKGDIEKANAPYRGLTPLSPEDVANTVVYCAAAPAHVNIDNIVIMPLDQAALSMVHRKDG